MKKLFSIISVLVIAFALSGCSNTEVTELQAELALVQAELADLQTMYDNKVLELENESDTLELTETELAELAEEIIGLEEELDYLESLIYDNIITVTMDDGYGNFTSSTVGYNSDFDGNLLDLLDESFLVTTLDTEYGKMLIGLDDLNSMYGSYISFGKNGAPSMVGVEAAEFDDGDVFTFEISWWDTKAQMVDYAIHLFTLNQAANYVNDETLDYQVVIGLDMLGVLSEYVSDDSVLGQLDIDTTSTKGELFKASYILDAIGVPNDATLELLNTSVGTGTDTWEYWYSLQTFNAFDNTLSNVSALETLVLTDLDTTSPYDQGADAGSMKLITLSDYDSVEVNAYVAEFALWISTDQLATGGFQTRDTTWGETSYPGTENSSTLAQIILGFTANGIDPTGVDYTKNENNLVSRLVEFQNEDGSFDYLFEDETADLMFSTPQAFLALVAYQEFLNSSNEAVNVFNR